jgi:hypothetical protein
VATKRLPPSQYSTLSIKDMALKTLTEALQLLRVDEEDHGLLVVPEAQLPVADGEEGFIEGWARRFSVKAPALHNKIEAFSHWCWQRGEQGNTKIDPSMVIELMPMFGREEGSEMFPQATYWAEAVAETNGEGIFTDTDLPETASIKKFYSKWVASKKSGIKMMAQTVHLSPAQKREDLLSRLKELDILKSMLTSTELYTSLAEHVASTVEHDNKRQYGNVIQKDLAGWEHVNNVKLTQAMKRAIISVIHNVGVAQVIVGATSSSSSNSDDITTNSGAEIRMSAQADSDDADEEELSPYPMFEGILSELCEAIQNDNGDEGDEGDDDIDNNEDIC